MSFLKVAEVSKKQGNNLVVDKITFSQERFTKIAIAGETGSGKSSLLKIIAGLIQRSAGEVLFENEAVLGPEEKLMPGRREIVYLSQHFELPNNYIVEEVLQFENKIDDAEAEVLYDICKITPFLKRKTSQLSGGEKQRIAIARLLIRSPKLLLLDEPYSNLDAIHKNILKAVINDIVERLKITCILISHDPLDTLSWADEIIVMKDGAIVQKDTPTKIYLNPVNTYVAGLFGKYNSINPSIFSISKPEKIDDVGKKLFVRPENITVSKEVRNGIEGTVKKINYYGSFYELEVLVSGTTLTIRTSKSSFKAEDIVYLSLLPDPLWYF